MTQDKTGGAAFPGETVVRNGMHSTKRLNNSGMTLRDWFAGQALASVIADLGGSMPRVDETWAEMVARKCYEIADAMIAARNGGQDT